MSPDEELGTLGCPLENSEKELKIWAYILHLEQVQSPVNTESRLTAYTFQLNSTEERFERILRSNKKRIL